MYRILRMFDTLPHKIRWHFRIGSTVYIEVVAHLTDQGQDRWVSFRPTMVGYEK